MSHGKDETRVCGCIHSEFIHWDLFVHLITSILVKLSTWCFEHTGDISCSLLVNPSHTDESGKDETRVYGYIRSEFTHCVLFVHHTTSILAKLSTRCFEHSGDISCSVLVNPKHTDESWEGRNTCLWIYTLWIYSLCFVRSPHNKYFGKAQHPVLWALWWHQLFSTR